ncbi:MAG TPA: porin [Sphingomicrobium sp.]|nr:porin [Sphingomicrobium sp.]
MKLKLVAALLAGSAFAFGSPVAAQTPLPSAQQEVAELDPSDAAADAAIASAASLDDAQSKIELMQAQIEALQESIAQIKGSLVKATPSWKGAPQLEDKDDGWSFKPRGRIQWDAGYVTNPDNNPNGGLLTRNLGFNTRARRIRLGAEGTIPGGFGYKAEMDFAGGSVGFGDVVLTYAPKGKPFNFIIGNHETWNGLEQISSSRFLSFMERAAFDDAFVNTRRIGVSAGLVNKAGDMRLSAGLFAAHSIDNTFDNEGWIAAARGVYSPVASGNQLHFGANLQHRKFQANNNGATSSATGAPSTNQLARYRARPFTQTTDIRFVDTGSFAAKSDTIAGLEFAGIFKSLHVAAEGQYLWAKAYGRGDRLNFADGSTLNLFPGNLTTVLVPGGGVSFWGGYLEAGYYLTGETRGYKNGTWDRTKVLKPFSKGGWGAVQLNGRVDYLNLADSALRNGFNNNFQTGVFAPSLNDTRGGKQLGLLTSLVWIPEDYMRFYFQYSHAFITGGPFADEVRGVPATTPGLHRAKYGVDFVGTRAQIDF